MPQLACVIRPVAGGRMEVDRFSNLALWHQCARHIYVAREVLLCDWYIL